MILGLGSESFDQPATSRYLGPLIQWLWPAADVGQLAWALYWIRKLAHVTEFGLLAILVLRATTLGHGLPATRAAFVALGVSGLVACLDEGGQSLSTTRSGSGLDVALDLAGAGFFLLAAARLTRALGRPLFPLRPRRPESASAVPVD